MPANIRYIRHDIDANRVVHVPAAYVRKALGADLFERLLDQVAEYGSYCVAIRGYVFEARRVG